MQGEFVWLNFLFFFMIKFEKITDNCVVKTFFWSLKNINRDTIKNISVKKCVVDIYNQ